MDVTKRARLWTSIGTAVLVGTTPALAGLDHAPAADKATGPSDIRLASVSPDGEGEGEGEGGEGGGEGGEFGVDPNEARVNPIPYGIALDVIRAHYLAGRVAYKAGDKDSAGELFVHPISEIYLDMEPVFVERGVAPFEDLMVKAGELALAGADVAAVDAAIAAVLQAVDGAEIAGPDGDLSPVALNGALIADMIDRAALQYQFIRRAASAAAYLDGYGYFATARQRANRHLAAIEAENADLASAIVTALDLLAKVYPGATPPNPYTVEPSDILAASSKVKLAL